MSHRILRLFVCLHWCYVMAS